jgi:apolipoprotein N-acyltransferase
MEPSGQTGLVPLSPWRVLLALSSGLLLALSFPSADQGWLAWVALIPLLVAVRGLRPAGGFVAGLLPGTLFFAILLHYIGQFGLLPWLALSVFQGLFVALFGLLASVMWRCPCPWLRVAALGASWTGCELLRGHFGALQFTFGDLGYTQHRAVWILQLASLIGHYGLGLAIAAFSAAVVEATPRLGRGLRPATGGPAVIGAGLLLAALIWGAVRIPLLRAAPTSPPLGALAVQGNIEVQPLGTSLTRDAATLYARRSLREGKDADLIVWPETSIPAHLNLVPDAYASVRSVPRRLNCHLMAGANEAGPAGQTYNSLWVFGPDGNLIGRYRKQDLVIFGEYVPWRDRLKFLNAYPIRSFDYSPGRGDLLVSVKGVRVAPMICFESIFPAFARRLVGKGAELLVVITSDAWVGRAPAELAQHAQCSVLRAVETGRWLVRAAGTGITCIIDPSGRVVTAAPIFQEASVRAPVWPERRVTMHQAAGDIPLVLVTCLLLLAGLADLNRLPPAGTTSP